MPVLPNAVTNFVTSTMLGEEAHDCHLAAISIRESIRKLEGPTL
jgi:hypothetical protein